MFIGKCWTRSIIIFIIRVNMTETEIEIFPRLKTLNFKEVTKKLKDLGKQFLKEKERKRGVLLQNGQPYQSS